MESKIKAAVRASDGGCAVTIASGMSPRETILDIIRGRKVGTFITPDKDQCISDTAIIADEGFLTMQCLVLCTYIAYLL